VPCIIELDKRGEPFVSEALPLEVTELLTDEVQLLYLQKSIQTEDLPQDLVLGQFLLELKQTATGRKTMTAVREADNITEPEKIADAACFVKKYKPVALKVKPVLGTLPERFRIIRDIRGDPLKDLPILPERPPDFIPKGRYTAERKEKLNMTHGSGFLWPEERKLMHWMIAEQNQALTWEDPERGRFKEEYFLAIEIPTVAHVLWVERPFRIPPAIYEEICGMIKKKINAGMYKPSNSSYRS